VSYLSLSEKYRHRSTVLSGLTDNLSSKYLSRDGKRIKAFCKVSFALSNDDKRKYASDKEKAKFGKPSRFNR
jgi:hypothetical protein